jgi:uncharacterized membrane protein YhfC
VTARREELTALSSQLAAAQIERLASLVVQRTLASLVQYSFRAYKLTVFLNENIGFQANESWTRSLKGTSLMPRNLQKWPELFTSRLVRSFLHH